MRPDHPDPTVRIIKPIRWDVHQDPARGKVVRLWSEKRQQWSVQRSWTGDVHKALEAGASFSGIVAVLSDRFLDQPRDWQRRTAGTYLYQLWAEGYVDLGFGEPPRTIDGYQVERELGRGAVGVALLCRDASDAPVVVKHAWDWFFPLDKADAAIRREDEVLSAMSHARVVRRIAAFEKDDLLHLVRDYVDGRAIAETPSSGEETRRIGRELVEIMRDLHRSGWLLVDMGPGNFLDTPHGIVLADAGSLTRHEGGTSVGKGGGASPVYAAPETRTERTATIASDLYGLGRLLFAVATGRPPLAAWGPDDLRRGVDDALVGDLVADLTALTPHARPSLDVVLSRLA